MEKWIRMFGQEAIAQQLELEARYKSLGQEATRKAYEQARTEEGGITRTNLGQKLLGYQFESVLAGIQAFVTNCLKPRAGTKAAYTLIVEDMSKVYKNNEQMFGMLTLAVTSVLLNNILAKHCQHSNLCQAIAKELYDEVKLQAFLNELDDRQYTSVLTGLSKRVQALYRRAYAVARMEHEGFTFGQWNRQDAMQLAACLIQVVLKTSTYFEEYKHENILEIQPSQSLLEGWTKNEEAIIEASFRLCPTIIPPRPWKNYMDGGYYGELQSAAKLLRVHRQQDAYSKNYMATLNQLELEGVRKAVNAIQATPWKINKKVLEVLQALVKRGGGVAGIPNLVENVKPSVLPRDYTEEQLLIHKKKLAGWYRSETRRKSVCLRALSNIRIADEFKDYERIYFPCNMDFRGRVYPIPSFNFQGDDVNKSLILFADVPACTSLEDYGWLLVEGANLAGVDKVSYDDRKQWVLDNKKNIEQAAKDPLGNLWWAEQDSPCQFLAWCFEYARAQEHIREHGSIIGFVTGINIAFDGTCSGLQHFSAILRDPIGGQAVNLIPSDKPNDIYAIVADKVNKVLKEDARTGTLDEEAQDKEGTMYLKYGTRNLAQQWLAFGVTRKVTKRSVMTLAYGSKEYGFKDQILVDTIQPDIDEKADNSIFAESKYQAARYLAKLVWNAVGTTVVKAVEGMKWLQDCAKAVTKDKQVVSWMSPMGLLIQQSYMETKTTTVMLRCAGKRLRLYDNRDTGNIDKRKQGSGIAPNFIHSMDAAHLQLTVCNCGDAGIKHFAMIHDSYGAPLAQAQLIYDVVRQSFIEMYTKNDVLDNFYNDMSLLTTKKLPEPPQKGTLDIQVVLDSQYIFS